MRRDQRPAVQLLRPVVTRHLLALRCDKLAHRHGQQHQRNRGFHYRQRHLQTGKAGGLHHHQFAALRQRAQPQQRAQQRRHREEDLDIFRHAEQRVVTGIQRGIRPLPGFTQLIDELNDARQRHQHDQRHHDGVEDGFADIAVKDLKHHTDPPRLKRARKRRIGTVSHTLSATASARYARLTTHIQIAGSNRPFAALERSELCSRKKIR